jgi:hypothetical protein
MVYDYGECGVPETSEVVYLVGVGVFDKDSAALRERRERPQSLPPGYTMEEVLRQRQLDQPSAYQP